MTLNKFRFTEDCFLDFDEMLRDRGNENPKVGLQVVRDHQLDVAEEMKNSSARHRGTGFCSRHPQLAGKSAAKHSAVVPSDTRSACEVTTDTPTTRLRSAAAGESETKMNEHVFDKELNSLAFLGVRTTMTSAVKERLTSSQAKNCLHAFKGGWRDGGYKFWFLLSQCFFSSRSLLFGIAQAHWRPQT